MYTHKTTKVILSDFDYGFVPNEEKDQYVYKAGFVSSGAGIDPILPTKADGKYPPTKRKNKSSKDPKLKNK